MPPVFAHATYHFLTLFTESSDGMRSRTLLDFLLQKGHTADARDSLADFWRFLAAASRPSIYRFVAFTVFILRASGLS